MKTGRTLEEMAKELDRQAKVKRDFVAPSGQLSMEVIDRDSLPPPMPGEAENEHQIQLGVTGHGQFNINDLGHEQIAGRLAIPQKYYDRMRTDEPRLLKLNVNTWLSQEPKEKRMVRTLDGNVRAFLSDRYRPLDNYDLAEIAFDRLTKAGCRIESTELTERRLYIKAVTDRIRYEVRKGDVVQAGIVISNSEVGCGSVKIEPLVFRVVCLNGLIAADAAMKRYHVGRSGSEGDFAQEFFKNETRQADDKAFWMKVRDVITGAFDQIQFSKIVDRMKFAADQEIKGSVEGAIEIVQEKFGFNDDERGGILRHLIHGGDLSQWGLVNAITRSAQDAKDYDRATEIERLGGVVLELPRQDWAQIAEAKAA